MKKMIFAAAMLLAASLIFAQNPGTDAGNRIAERVEAAETSSSDQKALVKEIAEAARKAGKDNPKDADKVKEAVRKKLDEIRDRKSESGKPGGKNNKEVEEWVKKLKRDLMDNSYVSLPNFAETPLVCSATGTGRTTGHIANLALYNPTNQPIAATLGPCFIPSGGQYQPYIVPTATPVTVPPYSTANVPVNGFCADIFAAPVPAGSAMPPVSNWLKPDQDPATAALLDAVRDISTAYDRMKNEGNIATPFSGNPEKEREAVIQQTFWIHAAELNGKKYEKEHFKTNTVKQFETATGLNFEKADEKTRNNVTAGVDQFWSTFEAVGTEAKVLAANDVDYDKIEKADDLPKLIRPAYDRYAAARALGSSHAKAMKDAFSSEDAREEWDARFKKIYDKSK